MGQVPDNVAAAAINLLREKYLEMQVPVKGSGKDLPPNSFSVRA